MVRRVPIASPQPSQLYLNGRKLSLATEWFDFDEPNYEPLPVIEQADELVLSDGHTRAFLAWLAGADELRVRSDPDSDELDMELYAECVSWCRDAEIHSIADLAGRLVTAETWEADWVRRCQRAADRLERDE